MIRADRRQFIWLGINVVGAATIPLGRSGAAEQTQQTLTVFDHRFDDAQRLAVQLARGTPLQPIAGDVTDLALWLQSQASESASANADICIRGITPESIPFCLGQFVPRARVSIQRLDRDLFSWSLRLAA